MSRSEAVTATLPEIDTLEPLTSTLSSANTRFLMSRSEALIATVPLILAVINPDPSNARACPAAFAISTECNAEFKPSKVIPIIFSY